MVAVVAHGLAAGSLTQIQLRASPADVVFYVWLAASATSSDEEHERNNAEGIDKVRLRRLASTKDALFNMR